MEAQDREEIVKWLTEKGHTPAEIEKIVARVQQFDSQMVRASVFDSIASGIFNLDEIVSDALGDEKPASE